MKKRVLILSLLMTVGIVVQAQTNAPFRKNAKKRGASLVDIFQQRIQNMTFEEYEAFINESSAKEIPTRAELKKEYNKMHQNDGKAVKIYPEDSKKSEKRQMLEAIENLANAKNYAEFKHYYKMLEKQDIPEEILKKLWEVQEKRNAKKDRGKYNEKS